MSEITPTTEPGWLGRTYDKLILAHPLVTLIVMAIPLGFFGYWVHNFSFDATSDSMVLEDDPDLHFYDETRQMFGSDDYVVLTVTPDEPLFSRPVLEELEEIHNALAELDNVASVTSILNVPLFKSPPVALMEIATGYRTLMDEDMDLQMAREEFKTSPIYTRYIISEDLETSALQVTFKRLEPEYYEVQNRRAELIIKKNNEGLTDEEWEEYKKLDDQYTTWTLEYQEDRLDDMAKIRSIMDEHRDMGELYLGGLPMIMSDIITFVKRDIYYMGAGVLAFMLIMLALLFRKPKWIVLPVAVCMLTVMVMMGYMGFINTPVTFVTSNFPPLLLVIVMTMAIHIMVRYREMHAGHPDWPKRKIMLETMRYVGKPCLYTTLTTAVGFMSLIVCRIPPVVDFGYVSAYGLVVGFILCFTVFPAAALLFPKGKPPNKSLAELKESPTRILAFFTEHFGKAIAVAAIVLAGVSLYGASKLRVENRFIDYFRSDTEIYEGMTVLDEKLGGTTPFEIVLTGPEEDFWLQQENRAKLEEIHEWFDGVPETGKVLSLHTMLQVLEDMTGESPVSDAMLELLRPMIPQEMQEAVIAPYVTSDFKHARLTTRVKESRELLNRADLLERVREHLDEVEADNNFEAEATGAFVLYHNLIQSLFRSQILTLGTVFFAVWCMFILLFQSVRLASIAIIPNALPVAVVLGALGWAGIPLDVMTITIAAITLGIAVDFEIHYMHRFKAEFPKDRDYVATMYRCHNSIGRGIYYATITIVIGFSILVSSNFMPSAYFGIFTSLVMIVAFLASSMLLPLLVITWKPLGAEAK